MNIQIFLILCFLTPAGAKVFGGETKQLCFDGDEGKFVTKVERLSDDEPEGSKLPVVERVSAESDK